ncbi:MAG: ubiquinol-cytochrome C reductase [Candidatus Nephrothrix sp. EaCA]|nr:MAG: ubiquinol-cytochrome C reductase [Candidatus Nephrothrix sp. EaCA]
MNYWLVKSEPGTYSWADFLKEKKTTWDGVRNYAARIHLRSMKRGDSVLFYHSGDDRCIKGTAIVSKEAFPDVKDNEWSAVELTLGEAFGKDVTLADVKAAKELSQMALVRISRLSVQPVTESEYRLIIKMSK